MALSNNLIRIIVSIIAIPFILLASYVGKIFFLIFILAIALISFYEFSVLVKKKGMFPNLFLGFIAVIFFVLSSYRYFFDIYSFILLFILLLTFVELFRNKNSALYNISATLIGVFYIGLFASAAVSIRQFYPDVGNLYLRGGFIIISIFAAIWICDSAAFYGGTRFGKHKLFPRVSPNKSWEGAIFGFFFAILTMIFTKIILLDFLTWLNVIIIGFLIGTLGQIGDLIESLFKRDAGVKNSSELIPGHGGIFDRFDSFLYSVPVILLYLKYFGR